jgi:hypothetical protein
MTIELQENSCREYGAQLLVDSFVRSIGHLMVTMRPDAVPLFCTAIFRQKHILLSRIQHTMVTSSSSLYQPRSTGTTLPPGSRNFTLARRTLFI